MVAIRNEAEGFKILCEITGNEGDYLATLTSLVQALDNPNLNDDTRHSLCKLLLSMLPNENQLNFKKDAVRNISAA